MNRAFLGDVIGRFRRTFEPAKRPVGCCSNVLGKMNLPPLMGRRDAAYDEASKLFSADLFGGDDESRLRCYRRIGELLRCAEEDSTAILSVLSSQDTVERERRQQSFFSMLSNSVAALAWFIELEGTVFRADDGQFGELEAVQTGAELARGERMVAETEQNIVNQLRNLFERIQPRIVHYRGYARKNFSPDNLERYERALRFYRRVYGADNAEGEL